MGPQRRPFRSKIEQIDADVPQKTVDTKTKKKMKAVRIKLIRAGILPKRGQTFEHEIACRLFDGVIEVSHEAIGLNLGSY